MAAAKKTGATTMTAHKYTSETGRMTERGGRAYKSTG